MITPEHFAVLNQLQMEAEKLRLLCIAKADGAALVHMAFGAGANPDLPEDQSRLLGKLRLVKR